MYRPLKYCRPVHFLVQHNKTTLQRRRKAGKKVCSFKFTTNDFKFFFGKLWHKAFKSYTSMICDLNVTASIYYLLVDNILGKNIFLKKY